MLTGRNHHSVGMRGLSNWNTGFPNCAGSVPKSAATLAEMIRPQGYSTFAVGKWHLTPMEETSAAGPFDQWPLARGFDRFYGFMQGEKGQATVLIDGVACGQVEVPQVLRMISSYGMDAGRDSGSAVGDDYQAPFEFQGRILQLVFDMPARNKRDEKAVRATKAKYDLGTQ
jgi:Sulfatase